MKRLIIVIVIFALFLAFIVLNINNKCDVSLGFITFTAVPVFLSALFSFAAGMLFAVPLILIKGGKPKEPPRIESAPPAEKKHRFGLKKRKESISEEPEAIKKEDSSYGID